MAYQQAASSQSIRRMERNEWQLRNAAKGGFR
jgi:hypothetical protein